MNKLLIISLVMFLQACATGNSYTPTAPSIGDARDSCPVTAGTIIDLLNVTLEESRQTSKTVGAGIGGYIANEATDDKNDATQLVATLAGAVIGDAVGNAVSKSKDRNGIELIIEVKGKARSIIQEVDPNLQYQKGDAVWVTGFLDTNKYSRYNTCSSGIRVIPRSL
jgi:outer membrane lipoprotein SlyB